MRGDSAEAESKPGFGHCCKHGGAGNLQGLNGTRSISKFEAEFLDRLQELELQNRPICSENLKLKNVLTRLYNLVYSSHIEAKAHFQSISAKLEHMEEALGPAYQHKVRKHNVSGKDLEVINRKMEKLQKFMANEGNFVDLSAEKNSVAISTNAAMDFGLQ